MKTFLLVALLALTAFPALADIQNAPFFPEEDARFNAIEQGNHILSNKFPMGSADGHWVQQEVQATYDFSKLGGASTVPFDLGISLPKNAVVMQTGAYSITKPTTGSGAKLAFSCGLPADGNNLVPATAAASYAVANKAIAGVEDNTIANWSTISAKCDVNATISVGTLTAGKVTLFIDYVTHQ